MTETCQKRFSKTQNRISKNAFMYFWATVRLRPNHSISAVGLVQTRYAPLHNYHVTVCRRSGVTYTRYRSIGTHTRCTLKWFVYRRVAARVQIQVRRRSRRRWENSARSRSARACSGAVDYSRTRPRRTRATGAVRAFLVCVQDSTHDC